MSVLKPKLASTLTDYTKEQFFKDVTAGIIVAIIALPLSIALAIASGVSPEKGLYTAIVAGFLISLLGGSRVQIGGPTGAFMVIVYSIVASYGVEGLTIATIMAGLMMIVMGFLKMGSIIKFIPYPITTGFTSGIALVIFSSQIKDFLGLSMGAVPSEFIEKWHSYIEHIDTISMETLAIGSIALAIILLWPKVTSKVPGAFVALIVTAVLVKVLNLPVETIGSKFGTLSSKPPQFILPNITLDKVTGLIGPAFTIAVLGSIESLLSAVVSDAMIGAKHRSNMELIAQGVANTASGLFGGIPATGAIARTVANIKNGGRTPVAGIVHAMTLLLILVVFMPYAKLIPLTALAAVLIVVAYNMSEWREFVKLFKSPKSDMIVLLVTFAVTVMVDLVKAIEIGMILAAFLFMKRMSDVSNVDVCILDASEGDTVRLNEDTKLKALPGVQVYDINGPFFFGAADKFLNALGQIHHETDTLLVRMQNVPSMDATALHAFSRMVDMCGRKSIDILICGVNEQPHKVMVNSGLVDKIGPDSFFETDQEAIEHICRSEKETSGTYKVRKPFKRSRTHSVV